jgi:hypothetical protein
MAYDTPTYEIFWKNYYILISLYDKFYLFPTCNVKSIIITMFGMIINIYVYGFVITKSFKNYTYSL